MLIWLQFTFTGDQTGAYITPEAMVLFYPMISEGETLFAPALEHLCHHFPEAYAPPPTSSTLDPPGPDYANYSPNVWATDHSEIYDNPTGWAPECREVTYVPSYTIAL